MGRPNASVTVGVPTASSDGKFYSRYPRGNRFALLTSVAIRKTPSGIIDSRFPDGNDGAGDIPLVWDTSSLPSLENLATGGAGFSQNVRVMLQDPGSPAATITVQTLSGDNAASEGWSISGNNLVNPLSDAGAGVLRLVATRNGVTVTSSPLVWSKYVATTADTLAPTIVTGLVAIPGQSKVDLAWDAACDPHDGTTPGALKEYDVKLGPSVVQTVAASSAGLSPKLTISTIGSVTPSPSVSQSGSTWSVTVAGAGFYAAVDSGVFVGAPVTGDGAVTLKVDSLTMPTTSCAIGPQVRESLTDTSAKLVQLLQTSSVANVGLRARARVAGGQAAGIVADVPGVAAPNWLRIARRGNTFTASYSLDGNTFDAVASVTIDMPATVYFGFAASSGANSTTFDTVVQQLAIATGERVTYSHATTVGGNYSIVARDLALNAATASAWANAVPIVSAVTRRWNPGPYMGLRGHAQAHWPSAIASIASNLNVRGVLMDYEWKQIEVAENDYDFSQVAADFALVKAAGKQFYCRINSRVFGSDDPNRRVVPNYVWNAFEGHGQVRFANGGHAAKIWEGPIMDRMIAVNRALLANFDSDSAFEAIGTDETSIGFSSTFPAPGSFSNAALLAQFERLAACRLAGTKANLFILSNYLGSDAQMEQLIQTAKLNKCGIGGPDTWSRAWVEAGTRALQSDSIVRGLRGTQHDYRDEVIVVNECQETEMGGYIASFSAAQLYDTAVNIMNCHYLVIDHLIAGQAANSNSTNLWASGWIPQLASVGGATNTTKPSGY